MKFCLRIMRYVLAIDFKLSCAVLCTALINPLSAFAWDPDEGTVPVTFVPIATGEIFFILPLESSSLPADPGKGGMDGVEGIDLDGDGVRDDVERYIAYRHPNSPVIRRALYRYARSKGYALGRPSLANTKRYANFMQDASTCLRAVRAKEGDAYNLIQEVEAIILNTEERFRTNMWLQKYLAENGWIFSYKVESMNYCI